MIQLVLSGNKIIAHGSDCFLSMGGTVICTETGRKFDNATIAECEAIPADIDSVGYEYHAGRFVPCAPFGMGTGTVPVLCDDCKTIKDSGVHLSNIAKHELLWENASPNSTFDGQTLTLKDAEYDTIRIEAKDCVFELPKNSSGVMMRIYNLETNAFNGYMRNVTHNGSSLSVSNIWTISQGGTSAFISIEVNSMYKSNLIPQRVYGVKI